MISLPGNKRFKGVGELYLYVETGGSLFSHLLHTTKEMDRPYSLRGLENRRFMYKTGAFFSFTTYNEELEEDFLFCVNVLPFEWCFPSSSALSRAPYEAIALLGFVFWTVCFTRIFLLD